MTDYTQFTLVAVQSAPVYFDREASTDKACRLILDAGEKGADLVAFSETWLPGYPFYIWENVSGSVRDKLATQYLANAVKIPGDTTDRLCETARQAGTDVVIGVAELDSNTRGTVYCTLLFISNEGKILGRHRKLKPTQGERTVWGEGDGSSLVVYERPYGKISGLNCWEHNMMLPGYALVAQGTQIHVAAWPGIASSRHKMLSQAFASQAGAYVLDVGAILTKDTVPAIAKDSISFDYQGVSYIFEPNGEIASGPAEGETMLVVKGSTEDIYAAKSQCDIAGHYSRPDIFQLHVNRKSYPRMIALDEPVEVDVDPEHEET